MAEEKVLKSPGSGKTGPRGRSFGADIGAICAALPRRLRTGSRDAAAVTCPCDGSRGSKLLRERA
jgi:hypothetical protein